MAYATTAQVKTYLGISTTGDDTLIGDLIDRAEAWIENHTNRIFESTGDTTRKFTVGVDTDGDTLFFDEDTYSITTVTNNADAATGETVASTKYTTMPRNRTPYYAIKLLSSSDVSWDYTDDAEEGITVAGRWAFSATPPNDVLDATIRLTGYFYRQKDADVFDVTAIPEAGVIQVPQGIPRDVMLKLEPYRKRAILP